MAESLLAHLIPRVTAAEPAATTALSYVLNAAPEIAERFVATLGDAGVAQFEPGLITAEERHGDWTPDLTIRERGGALRVLVENKFWAGLTKAQPVAYLDQLPSDTPAALVFVAPARRMHSLWKELAGRCAGEQIELSGEKHTDNAILARSGNRTLAITSWKHILEQLRQAASLGGYDTIERDILQLRGLTDQQNTEEFLPIQEEEVTNAQLAARLINYSSLIDEIVERLVVDEVASTRNCSSDVGDDTSAGRWMRLHAKFGVWLGIDFEPWRDYGATPFWLEIDTSDPSFARIGTEDMPKARATIDESEDNGEGVVYIPIRLEAGVERDRVVDSAVAQVTSVAERLRQAFGVA